MKFYDLVNIETEEITPGIKSYLSCFDCGEMELDCGDVFAVA